jgi:hypothetical protein
MTFIKHHKKSKLKLKYKKERFKICKLFFLIDIFTFKKSFEILVKDCLTRSTDFYHSLKTLEKEQSILNKSVETFKTIIGKFILNFLIKLYNLFDRFNLL